MKVLVIDTTTADLVAALVTENGVIDLSERGVANRHSERLCLKVADLMKVAGVSFADLDAYACTIGPGSFTGIRIGVSTVKGYATACKKPYIAVNALEAIALSENCGARGKAVIDAGNGWYFADYKQNVPPQLVSYDDPRAENAGRAHGGVDFLDGVVQIVRKNFAAGNFSADLTPLYIRRSQAEENR